MPSIVPNQENPLYFVPLRQQRIGTRGHLTCSRRMKYPVTPDGRYFVVRSRLWRCTNPKIPKTRREKLVRDLMKARRERNRVLVDKIKRALGERGPTWWKGPDYNRHLLKNTPYASWFGIKS